MLTYALPKFNTSPTVAIAPSKNFSSAKLLDAKIGKTNKIIAGAIAPPETLPFPAEFSTYRAPQSSVNDQLVKKLTTQTTKNSASGESPPHSTDPPAENYSLPNNLAENKILTAQTLLLGVVINNQEVGTLDIVQRGNTLLIPLLDFAKIAGFTVDISDGNAKLKTPAGEVTVTSSELEKTNGVIYISDAVLRSKLSTNVELKTSDLALIVDLPWRRNNGEYSTKAADLRPEVLPPSSGLSSLRQELNFTNTFGNSGWHSSTLFGGRLAGGGWRIRLENDFINQPEIAEYFFFKRSNQFLYQIGRQQIGLHPLLSPLDLTGFQVGYSNLPPDRFNGQYGATELLSRQSQPIQSFNGRVPPASFVQLRVAGVVVAQQQVGLSGEYEFVDVNLPTGQTNDIELLVYNRNNLNIPIQIRSLRLRASDLLLPSGGTTQLAGFGLTGNYIQRTLFDDFVNADSGKLAGFYQARQGISSNLTLEGSLQVQSDRTQSQAGFIWRLINPAVIAASVGTSNGQVAYKADLDFQLDRLQIVGNSESYPAGYLYSSQSRNQFNHSVQAKYTFSNSFNLGVIARKQQYQSTSTTYILPTFSFSPFYNLSLRGEPDFNGRYLFNAFYRPTQNTSLALSAVNDIYTTDLSYNLSREYSLSFGTESGGDLPTRYTAILNRNASNFSDLSWRIGLGYRDGDIGPVIGASMRVLPGLFARVEYQGIPSRIKNIFGGIGDDRLFISLVSDLSFADGRMTPADYTSIGKDKGVIAGRIVIEGAKKGFDLSESTIQVINKQGQAVAGTVTDSKGNFFVGNLPEGVYVVQFDPQGLPVELTVKKSTIVAKVETSAVTKLDFPVRVEYGLAGRITDAAGKPIPEIEVEVINAEGKRISASASDEFGLYRLDEVPPGKYILRIAPQDGITNNSNLPTREIAIDKDFLYDQNLQLPFAIRTKEIKDK
ncbi:carboxypeptidase regulatory-like domain-containing protein [Nostoc sp. KVJ3]|uniref:carboxypeptidase regulatory-like domain-containing protein n=1 Tax=Nostoc sp. KVJ3 TaxID=457945 RepID=UPI002237C895|nr:carboxypeptidase regulatory-like domain-containing protein [Nostoc sp. KVJ3]